MGTGFVKKSGRSIDLTGKKFGRLTVVQDSGTRTNKKIAWECQCECGESVLVRSSHLIGGKIASCGCLRQELSIARAADPSLCSSPSAVVATHRMSGCPVYKVYRTMLQRCHNKNSDAYEDYGGRGIIVCDRWRGEGGFERFMEDMGDRPSDLHSIDRKENNGNYEPGNCHWATRSQQNRNTRVNRTVLFNGQVRLLIDVAAEVGIRYKLLHKRVVSNGMSIEEAVAKPIRKRQK